MQSQAATAYLTQEVMTASPARIVSMLYERAIRALRDAERAIERQDIEARYRHSARAAEIVSHLCGTLDTTRGGEIAANLEKLYAFMLRRLTDINVKNDAKAARDVIALLEPLAQSWRELAQQAAPQPKPAAASGGGAFALSA